jgi:nicotinate-nucleotide adenylyltransferase
MARAIGVMGGTFDPIHHGHLVAASEVAHRCGLDQVVFVPTGVPWQKPAPTPAEHRYLMTVIGTAVDARFSVSRVDIDRPGPTYTVDTLTDLRAHYGPDTTLRFITGADALRDFPTWRDPGEILAQARLIAVTRPDHDIDLSGLPDGAVSVVAIPALAISASEIRDRVRTGRPIDYLVPAGVASYVHKEGLYRGDRSGDA